MCSSRWCFLLVVLPSLFRGLSFDAVRLDYTTDQFTIAAWASKLAENFGNLYSVNDTDFYGVYGSYTGIEDVKIDAYYMYVRDQHGRNANTDIDIHTLGLRGAGKVGAVDFDLALGRTGVFFDEAAHAQTGTIRFIVGLAPGGTQDLIARTASRQVAAQLGQNKSVLRWLVLTTVLGLTFLVVKFFEYKEKFELREVPGPNFHFEGPESPHAQIFFSLYFAMTGVHALHMVIGFGLLSVIAWMAHKERFSKEWYTPVELAGLYWHFVDIVWIFLFPLLYLVDRTHKFV